MKAYTEGPWEIDEYTNLIGGDGEVVSIKCCLSYPNYQHPAAIANAILVSAAPDMLKVLEFLQWGRGTGETTCPFCGNCEAEGHHPSCDVGYAINKATNKR